MEGYPLDRIRQMFETNTLGALRVIQAVLPAWRQRGSGVIVNVSSVNGRVSSPLRAAYSASKFALEALTESLHVEVRHFGIRCVIIEPGNIAPGMKSGRALMKDQPTTPDFGSSGPEPIPKRRGHLVHRDPKLSH